MPNRIIKDSINESKGLAEVSPFAQDLYKRLLTYADDYGRFNAELEIIHARLYPREHESVLPNQIEDALGELIAVDKIRFYVDKVRRPDHVYGYLPTWGDHQRLRQTKTKLPDPEDGTSWNDWALRRFVPIEIKVIIAERDNLTCQECGVCFRMQALSWKQNLRAVSSAIHFDHVVPVKRGGRATIENLRILCAGCNLSRSKDVAVEYLRQLAAKSGEQRRPAASRVPTESNRIESELETETETEGEGKTRAQEAAELWGGDEAIAGAERKDAPPPPIFTLKACNFTLDEGDYEWAQDNLQPSPSRAQLFSETQEWLGYRQSQHPEQKETVSRWNQLWQTEMRHKSTKGVFGRTNGSNYEPSDRPQAALLTLRQSQPVPTPVAG